MGLSIKDLVLKTKPLVVHTKAGDIKVKYRPDYLSRSTANEIEQGRKDETYVTSNALYVLKLIDEWDLLDGEGKALPITNEVVSELPNYVLVDIVNQVMEDLNSGK